jgi:hypothetical protein
MRFGQVCVPMPALYSAIWPSVGLVTTPRDFVQVPLALLRVGDLLGPVGLRELCTPQSRHRFPGDPGGMWVGLALQLYDQGTPRESVGHGGAWPFGFWSEARAYPHAGYAVCVTKTCWDSVGYTDPVGRSVLGAVLRGVYDFMTGEPTPEREGASPDAMWSYAAGLLAFDRLHGVQGVGGRLSEDALRRMAQGAVVMPSSAPAGVDQDALIAGLTAQREPAPAAQREFVRSRACAVPESVLAQLAVAAGARAAQWTAPVPFWADRHERPLVD